MRMTIIANLVTVYIGKLKLQAKNQAMQASLAASVNAADPGMVDAVRRLLIASRL